jgi:HSP20 family protein
MGENETKLPVSQEKISEPASQVWQPFEGFRREIDRLFEDFGRSFWQPSRRSFFAAPPLWGREKTWSTAPAVDVVESEKAYEIKAEMPGMDEKNIEVKVANGNLTIEGEKQEEKEEKRRTIICMSANLAPSNEASVFQRASIRTRSRPPSKTVCST